MNGHSGSLSPPSSPSPSSTGGYDAKLRAVLEDQADSDSDDDFVYKTVQFQDSDSDEGKDYHTQLANILGDSASESDWKEKPEVNGPYSNSPPSTIGIDSSLAGSTPSYLSSPFPRRPQDAHISRLRSPTQIQNGQTSAPDTPLYSQHSLKPPSSGLDFMSRQSSVSNLADLQERLPGQEAISLDPKDPALRDVFRWSTLRKISQRVYPPTLKHGVGFLSASAAYAAAMGIPNIISVNGIIAIGTSKGWVMVFDYAQNIRCVCGTEAISKTDGEVTAIAISQDHTFVAVGHAYGTIHLYNLEKPTHPKRSVPPTTLAQIQTGRKEGHLAGTKILKLGFVGERHTAIVSSDEYGLAFYHSLGKVLGLASTDIIRMLGRYPEIDHDHKTNTKRMSIHPTTVFDMASLPLGPAIHPSDTHSFVALLTPTKLVVVGLKPSPRTWWRTVLPAELGEKPVPSRVGVLAWFPSASAIPKSNPEVFKDGTVVGEDPLLAWAWENKIRLLTIQSVVGFDPSESLNLNFQELEGWSIDSPVLGLQWYNKNLLLVMTLGHLELWDTQKRVRVGVEPINHPVVAHDHFSRVVDPLLSGTDPMQFWARSGSFKTYKQKAFILTFSDVGVGALLSWSDRILSLMRPSTILQAVELTILFYEGYTDSSTSMLPADLPSRQAIIGPKLHEFLNASVSFIFSDDRLRDGTHSDGFAIQSLFEGLVRVAVRACIILDDVDWLFDELYERFEQNCIESIFLKQIEPFILKGAVQTLPPSVSQRLIAIHADRGEYKQVEKIICHVDPTTLDINLCLRLCTTHNLYDALIHVYMRSIHDYVGPIVELVSLVRGIQRARHKRPKTIENFLTVDTEEETNAPDAYKVYSYFSNALTGFSYPEKELLVFEEGISARTSIYSFLFSGSTVIYPAGGLPVLTSDDDFDAEPTFPYFQLFLKFDSEAMLDALDLAFEDSYLDDTTFGAPVDRQHIVNLLLEITLSPGTLFSSVDQTFTRIFIARNVPKFSQFIQLSVDTLDSILVGLATDSDCSTVEDRQLAAEYLLSAHSPSDLQAMIDLFNQAGFFRILRSIYQSEKNWAALASTFLRDPGIAEDVFLHLKHTFNLALDASVNEKAQLSDIVVEAVPALVQAHESGLQETATLVDKYMPEKHDQVIAQLKDSKWRQFAYLRWLLEPELVSQGQERVASTRLQQPELLAYLSLLVFHEPTHILRFLETHSPTIWEDPAAGAICHRAGVYDAAIWIKARSVSYVEAFDLLDETMEKSKNVILKYLQENESDSGSEFSYQGADKTCEKGEATLEKIVAIVKVGISLCVEKTISSNEGEKYWFRLLAAIVSIVSAIRTASPPIDDHVSIRRSVKISTTNNDSLSSHASDILNSLIPTALSSLVSTTWSRQVSFPNLMKSLIESNSRSPAASRSYAQFKAIVSSMLETFVFEGEMLRLTSKIFSQDLFTNVELYKQETERGWRPCSDVCVECLRPVWGPPGPTGPISPPISRSASATRMVESLGMSGRPQLRKRPSLKGKEPEWADGTIIEEVLEPPKGIVVGRDGNVYHQSCHLVMINNAYVY